MTAPRITFALVALIGLTPASSFGSSILLLTAGDSSNNASLVSTLQAQGDSVTVGPTFSNFNGSGLSGYNAVMLAPGYSSAAFQAADMPTSGQQALLNFVNGGGGLVTGEGLVSLIQKGDFQALSAAIPVSGTTINTSNTGLTFASLTSDPTVTRGLPSTFSFSASPSTNYTETYFLPKAGATPLFSTNQWTSSFGGYGTAYGAISGTYGQGRVISLSTGSDTTELANPSYAQLVRNAANWATNSTGTPPVSSLPGLPPINGTPPSTGPILGPPTTAPEPTTLAILGLGVAGFLSRKWVGRKSRI